MNSMFSRTTLNKSLIARLDAIFPIVSVLVLTLILLVVFYSLWPWIWNNPLNWGRSIKHWTVVPGEYLLSVLYMPMPFFYYTLYFAVTTLLLFAPFAAGIICVIRSRDTFGYAIIVWLAVPFVYGFSIFIQDNMRYLLMIYPAVAILCALGILAMADWLGAILGRPAAGTIAFLVMGFSIALYLLATLLQ